MSNFRTMATPLLRWKAQLSRTGEIGEAFLHAADEAEARMKLHRSLEGVTVLAIEQVPEPEVNLEWQRHMDAPEDPSKAVVLPAIT